MNISETLSTETEPAVPVVKPWFVYLVRAANGSLYCGISDDPQRRFASHQSGKGARFFYSSPAIALVYVEACRDKGEALRQERLIKKLRKSAKENLAAGFSLEAFAAVRQLPTTLPVVSAIDRPDRAPSA